MPHERYIFITQSLALLPAGVPVRRGPIESKSTCARSQVCELSWPAAQICLRTGSLIPVCAARGVAARDADSAIKIERFIVAPGVGVTRQNYEEPTRGTSARNERVGTSKRKEAPCESLPSDSRVRAPSAGKSIQLDAENERRVGGYARLHRVAIAEIGGHD